MTPTHDLGHGDRVLLVRADLDVSVVAPSGRRGRVRLSDSDGVLVVRLTGLRALAGSLPSYVPATGLPRSGHVAHRARRVVDATWQQPVDVLVGDRAVLRRRAGRWRPTATLLGPALAVVAAVAGAVAALVAFRRRGPRHPGQAPSTG